MKWQLDFWKAWPDLARLKKQYLKTKPKEEMLKLTAPEGIELKMLYECLHDKR